MDFVEWCDCVLRRLVGDLPTNHKARARGYDQWDIARLLFDESFLQAHPSSLDFGRSTQGQAMFAALSGLVDVGSLRLENKAWWRLTDIGKAHIQDVTLLWSSICEIKLESEQIELLSIVNRLSPVNLNDHAYVSFVNQDVISSELGKDAWDSLMQIVSGELEKWGLINWWVTLRPEYNLKSSYKGLVWETRQGFTVESKFIDDLVADWENTSVDFKRELYLDTKDQKAEFIKDVIGLANTQTRQRRFMIIGFDDKTHKYHAPPDVKITQNRLEQILASNVTPNVEVKYDVVSYRAGNVGRIEVIRDPKKLPYKVATNMKGEKKSIYQGQIFVRHSSQCEEPTSDEVRLIQAEGDKARST
jgi:Putative DNA-binding domain